MKKNAKEHKLSKQMHKGTHMACTEKHAKTWKLKQNTEERRKESERKTKARTSASAATPSILL